MSKDTTTTQTGGNILGLLGIAFVVLKLSHVINWSWWWVTLPFWGGLALVLIVVMFLLAWALVSNLSGRS